MSQGDVTVNIVAMDTTAIDTAITAMRVTANDKYATTSIANGQQLMIAHLEEA